MNFSSISVILFTTLYVIDAALYATAQPTQEEPSGSINLSYVDDMQLFLKLHTTNSGNIHIYTRNYNILRVMSGQSGIIYLN